jgi:hypothetical protein
VPGVSEAHLDEFLEEEAVDNNLLMVSVHAAETVLSSVNTDHQQSIVYCFLLQKLIQVDFRTLGTEQPMVPAGTSAQLASRTAELAHKQSATTHTHAVERGQYAHGGAFRPLTMPLVLRFCIVAPLRHVTAYWSGLPIALTPCLDPQLSRHRA